MRKFFIPCSSGDYRLTGIGESLSQLEVTDPTEAEQVVLTSFMRALRVEHGLTVGYAPVGKTILPIKLPLAVSSSLFASICSHVLPETGELTVFQSVDGVVTSVVKGVEKSALETAAKDPDADSAVKVRRPTLCCPAATKGPDRRASEVARSFLPASEWARWRKHGVVRCIGGITGRRYEIAHRHHELARRRGYIVFDLESQTPLHCWDWRVPPPEEMLAAYLILTHAENWIRNAASLVGTGSYEDVLTNPFGTVKDGTWDASLFRSVAAGYQMGSGLAIA